MLEDEYQIMYNAETDYWWYKGLHELILFYVKQKSKGQKLDILDAGCGTGQLLELLSEYNSCGFDFSDKAIDFCKKRGLKNVNKQDINYWKSKQKYDVIISADVICSLGIVDEQKIMGNFYSALNKKGVLILNLPAFDSLSRNHDKAVFVRKRYSRKDVRILLEKSGFNNFFISYRLPFLFPVILTEKWLQKLFNKKEAKSDLSELPEFINHLLFFFNRIDNFFIKKRIQLPFGSSVFAIAYK